MTLGFGQNSCRLLSLLDGPQRLVFLVPSKASRWTRSSLLTACELGEPRGCWMSPRTTEELLRGARKQLFQRLGSESWQENVSRVPCAKCRPA